MGNPGPFSAMSRRAGKVAETLTANFVFANRIDFLFLDLGLIFSASLCVIHPCHSYSLVTNLWGRVVTTVPKIYAAFWDSD